MQGNTLQTPAGFFALKSLCQCRPCRFAHGLPLARVCTKNGGNFFPLFAAKVLFAKPAILRVFTFLFLEVLPCVN